MADHRISPRNPKTGTEVPTSRVVVFKASALLNRRNNRAIAAARWPEPEFTG